MSVVSLSARRSTAGALLARVFSSSNAQLLPACFPEWFLPMNFGAPGSALSNRRDPHVEDNSKDDPIDA